MFSYYIIFIISSVTFIPEVTGSILDICFTIKSIVLSNFLFLIIHYKESLNYLFMNKYTYFRVKESYPASLNLLIKYVLDTQDSASNQDCIVIDRTEIMSSPIYREGKKR